LPPAEEEEEEEEEEDSTMGNGNSKHRFHMSSIGPLLYETQCFARCE